MQITLKVSNYFLFFFCSIARQNDCINYLLKKKKKRLAIEGIMLQFSVEFDCIIREWQMILSGKKIHCSLCIHKINIYIYSSKWSLRKNKLVMQKKIEHCVDSHAYCG